MSKRTAFSSAPFFLALAAFLVAAAATQAQDAAWQREIKEFRENRAAVLLKPDGWLSLVGLEWLQPGDTSVGSAPDNTVKLSPGHPAHLGILHLENNVVTLLPPKQGFPAGLTVGGIAAKQQVLQTDADDDKNNPHLIVGTLNIYAIRREDRFALRIKDSQSPSLKEFRGLDWYAPDAAYRVTAKWIPYTPAKSVQLATLVGTSYRAPVPGTAEFTLQGKTYRLEPVLEEAGATELFFIMRDTTSATTTYGACRFLYTAFPSNGLSKPGELVLDFNKLRNPPCAYTPYATCPLPPVGNRLPIALPVGEKRYHG
ncbi:MAG: DUF1684 domain-containing protein [Acidobacteria bacterium]|nr:DUF1684 domain-containing protein [Acidobacteriota bacterium]MBS1866522.1 DUF1684 domain-containing protein [Acidobacteriota bacterium]